MMKNNRLHTTDELRRILGMAYGVVKNEGRAEITPEILIGAIVAYYTDPSIKYREPILEKIFSIMDKETLNTLRKGIKVDFKDLSEDFFVPSYAIFNESVENAFRDASEMTENVFPERHNLLNTDVVFVCLLTNMLPPEVYEGMKKIILQGRDNELEAIRREIPKILGSDMPQSAEELLKKLGAAGNENNDESEDEFEKYEGDRTPLQVQDVDPNSETPTLEQFSINMVKEAGKYDPVIGRDKEVDMIIEVLCKRKKANPVLVGEAGCGKSTVIELLAQRISTGNVPGRLKDKRIYALNLNDLVAGTKYRGEYEERLQRIIKEVVNHPEVIVYIDEIHNLVGSGSSSGNGDAANILKPYLSRGEFQCIGSTTQAEYRKFIEADAALNRRFTQIEITIPTAEETVKILNGLKDSYEKYHHVKLSKEVIEACVEWSGRYISDKNFPDKAIDILDLASSVVSLRVIEVEDTELQDKLKDIIERKIQAVRVDNDFELGEKLRDEEEQIKALIESKEKAKTKERNNKKNWPEVTVEDVAYSISRVSRIPIDKINQSDAAMLAKMRENLLKKVIGQDKAVNVITQAIQRNYLGLRDPKKPIASILAVGPSGVGKSLICTELAETFFGGTDKLIRIDGGMLKEAGSINTLLGAPPSFVGHDKEPVLLQVKRKPQCVLLIDEVEKMHSSIFDIFLNIMEEGTATLNTGDKIDFSNCIIIMTGNIGTKEIKQFGDGIGFGQVDKNKKNESIVKKAIEKTFKVEFLNRLSSIIVFNQLGQPELMKIFNLEFDKIKKQFKKKKYNITVTKALKEYVIGKCDKNFGARDLKRYLDQFVVDKVSEKMLDAPDSTKFQVDVEGENVVVK